MIKEYLEFITEHKLYGKSIKTMLDYLKSKSYKYWVFLDSETTGLPSNSYDVQLTQLSGIVVKYNYTTNDFEEVEVFNKKIKLTNKTKEQMKDHDNIKRILSFNHYGQKAKFHEEEETLSEFHKFIEQYDNPILVIQNAEFDMKYLNTRGSVKFKNEVIDTKQLLQYFYLPAIQKLAETDNEYRKLIEFIGTSTRDNGLISSSLSKIGPALNINMSGYHDALIDCRLLMEMFSKVVDFLKSNINTDISSYQYERFKSR